MVHWLVPLLETIKPGARDLFILYQIPFSTLFIPVKCKLPKVEQRQKYRPFTLLCQLLSKIASQYYIVHCTCTSGFIIDGDTHISLVFAYNIKPGIH